MSNDSLSLTIREFKAACKRTQQLPTLLRACWQWCANGCNNSQQCWDLQCIVGRIQPISLCKPCVMSVRGPKLCATTRNNMQQGVQTDATCNIQQCWELLANDVASVCTGLKIHEGDGGKTSLKREFSIYETLARLTPTRSLCFM